MEKRVKIFVALFLFIAVSLSAQYHPEIKWKEMARGDLILIFPEGYEETAHQTLDTAHELYIRLQQTWKVPIKRKTRIVLTDHTDEANGSTTYFPLNLITIYLYGPEPDAYLGNTQDWINLVLAHEMSHLFTFHMGSKFIRWMRKIFGSNPVFYPMTFAPLWMMEGLAIYGESISDKGGRLNNPDFFIFMASQRKKNEIPNWNRLGGQRTEWPGPSSPYLYGSTFLHYLHNTYRERNIVEFAHAYSQPLIILNFSNLFLKFYNKKLTTLWEKYQNSISPPENEPDKFFTHKTNSGHYHRFPISVAPNKILSAVQNYSRYPGIYEWNTLEGNEKKRINKSRITGMSYFNQEEKIYYSANDFYKTFYYYSDIYEWDIRKQKVKKLSKGKRLSYPVRMGNKLYCIQRRKSQSYLCQFGLEDRKLKSLSQGFDGMAFVSLSPDNQQIAATVKTRGNRWGIGIFDISGQLIKILSHPNGKNYYPLWKTDDELYFVSQTKNSYRLALYRPSEKRCWIQQIPELPPIQYFNWSQDQKDLILTYFNSRGYDLGVLSASKLTFKPHPGIMIQANTGPSSPLKIPPDHKADITGYHVLRDLIPQYFSPYGRIFQNRFQPGILLSGADALSKHSYWIEGFADIQNHYFNYSIDYAYNGLFPSLSFSHSDHTKFNLDSKNQAYDRHLREWRFRSMIPIKFRNNFQLWGYASLHLEQQEQIFKTSDGEENTFNFNGIRVGMIINTSKTYWDSISRSDGTKINCGYQRDFKDLGSTHNSNRAFFIWNQYIPMLSPGVLALRFSFLDSWGETQYLSLMGGAESNTFNSTSGDGLFDLMRGYPDGYFAGTGGALLNLELRIPLFKMEVTTLLGISLERFYLTLFSDIGNLWLDKIDWDPAISYGGELSLDVYLGTSFTLSGGVAWSHHPQLDPTFYFRVGKSF